MARKSNTTIVEDVVLAMNIKKTGTIPFAVSCVIAIALIVGCSSFSSDHTSESDISFQQEHDNTAVGYNTTTSGNKESIKPFTNKYGTRTTICAHSGCTNYIASSGDTNCCTVHSNRCLECYSYIDEDAMFCISCIEKAANENTSKKHTCEVCGKEGTYSIVGFSGKKEYYCYKHYTELNDLMKSILG